MKNKPYVLLIITSFFLLYSNTFASEFYIDIQKGKEYHSGTKKAPFKTITKGLSVAQPGDTILINSGTYREKITFFRSGKNAQQMISVRPAPCATVDIKGSEIVTGWQYHHKSVWKKKNWPINSQQVFVDGKPLQQIGNSTKFNTLFWGHAPILPIIGKGLAGLLEESFFYDKIKKTLFVHLPEGKNPNNHMMEVSVRDVIINSPNIDFIELKDLNFSHSNVTSIPYMMGMVNIEGQSWKVSGCTFNYGDFAGLNIAGNGHVITNNTCNYNGNLGISINGSDAAHNWKPYKGRPPQNILLDGNETSFNNYRKFYYYFQAGGLKAANACNDVKVIRHMAESNIGPGVWFDIDCKNIIIDKCFLKGNTRGIEYEISGKGLISNNIVIDNADHGIYVSASDNVEIINNTVHNNRYGIVVHGMPRLEHMSLKNNSIRNNIIGNSSKAHLVIYTDPLTATGNTSDTNLFFSKNSNVKISWAKSKKYPINYRNLKAFSSKTRQEKNSIVADPRWNDSKAYDFSLDKNSPAIDAGSNHVEIGGKDYSGKLRRLNGKKSAKTKIDIGAMEYSPVKRYSE